MKDSFYARNPHVIEDYNDIRRICKGNDENIFFQNDLYINELQETFEECVFFCCVCEKE